MVAVFSVFSNGPKNNESIPPAAALTDIIFLCQRPSQRYRPAAALIRRRICCANAVSLKKAGHKPDSVSLELLHGLPIIYLGQKLPFGSNRLPFSSGVQPSNTDLHDVAPYRVYLVSLQHYLYILSVALVLISRWTGVTRYTALWCPDFPPPAQHGER